MAEKPTLYLMLGYPGAGKTTVSEIIHDLTGAVHLNSDRFRQHMFSNPLNITNEEHENMYKHLDYIAQTILQSGKSVIYDANLNKYQHRLEKYQIAKDTGSDARLIWVKTDLEQAKKRATDEADSSPHHRPFGNMEKSTFDRLAGEIEAPTENEKFIEINGLEISPEIVGEGAVLMRVSIIIPSYNEATYIGRLLEDLSSQNFKDFEVIVSDANSKDKTDKVIKSYSGKLNLTLVSSPPKAQPMDAMLVQKAKGEWLLFLDADVEIDDLDFVDTLVKQAEKNNWQTASAKINPARGNLVERFGMRINYRYIKLLAKTKHPVAPGWCILTKRKTFEKHLGFNEKIQFGEDYDYVTRVGDHGYGFVTDTYYYVDFRRAREEGWRLTAKAILNEIYRHTHGYNLENNPYKYEFGKHKERK